VRTENEHGSGQDRDHYDERDAEVLGELGSKEVA